MSVMWHNLNIVVVCLKSTKAIFHLNHRDEFMFIHGPGINFGCGRDAGKKSWLILKNSHEFV